MGIRDTILNSMGKLVGVAIGLVILAIISGLTLFAAYSAGLGSAIDIIVDFLPIIGIGVAVGLMLAAMKFARD